MQDEKVMLELSVGEEAAIGDPHKPLGTVRVVGTEGEKVRLSFDFPRDIAINRRELAHMKTRRPPSPATTWEPLPPSKNPQISC